MHKKKIILIGGGGHCKSCIDVLEQQNKFSIAGIVDLKEKIGQEVSGYPIVACDDDIELLSKKYNFFLVTLGHLYTPERRIQLFNILMSLNVKLPVVISPYSYVSRNCSIGNGTIIMHHVVINSDATIGTNCIINSKALIEHDAIIGDHCHIATGAIINGGVRIGQQSFVGSGVVTKQYASIPDHSFIKANSLYT